MKGDKHTEGRRSRYMAGDGPTTKSLGYKPSAVVVRTKLLHHPRLLSSIPMLHATVKNPHPFSWV